MELALALLLKPFIALVVFGIPCAAAVTFVRRLPDSWFKRLLLVRIHRGQSNLGPDGAIEKACKWVARHARQAVRRR